MSALKTLQNAWHDFTNGVAHFFFSFVDPLVVSIQHNGGEFLVNEAKIAVAAAENTAGGWQAKRDAAFEAIVASLTAQGLPIVINAINGAIEAAVAAQKAA